MSATPPLFAHPALMDRSASLILPTHTSVAMLPSGFSISLGYSVAMAATFPARADSDGVWGVGKRPLLSIHWLPIDLQCAAAHLPTASTPVRAHFCSASNFKGSSLVFDNVGFLFIFPVIVKVKVIKETPFFSSS